MPLNGRSSGRFFFALCAALAGVFAPAAAQTVDGVEAVQVGTKLEIRYGLDAPAEVSVWLSEDSGTSWTELTTCLSGDCGKVTTAGRKVAVWDVLSCRESLVGSGVRFKVRTGKPDPCAGAERVTFDGYDYRTVAIGNQCWFAENLRSDNYCNGNAIHGNLNGGRWSHTSFGAQAIYENELLNLSEYGRLYNWKAVKDARGLCPTGWHVPSDVEWTALTETLGGEEIAGELMKSSSWGGFNASGFSALPGGYRSFESGNFNDIGTAGFWWSSSLFGSEAWYRVLSSEYFAAVRNRSSLGLGFSVRCIRINDASCFDPDDDRICAEKEIGGCTNKDAANFDSSATEDDDSCLFTPCIGAERVTFDGYEYQTVAIGKQCWFAENLRSDNYRSGAAIPGNLTDDQWKTTTAGAQAVYENDPKRLSTYGRLYNWYAVNDARGLCPSGWHLPTGEEWSGLAMLLGGFPFAGEELKTSSWGGTNVSGFTALPGGGRGTSGDFIYIDEGGNWWSSTSSGSEALCHSLSDSNSILFPDQYSFRVGQSVRCVRD